jgi:hypothetical protein
MENPWEASIPPHQPTWLKERRNTLADEGIIRGGTSIEFDVILSGAECLSLIGPAVYSRAKFAIKATPFGEVVAGTWSYDKEMYQSALATATVFQARVERMSVTMSADAYEVNRNQILQEEASFDNDDIYLNEEIVRWHRMEENNIFAHEEMNQVNKESYLRDFQETFKRSDDGRVIVHLPKRQIRVHLSTNLTLGKERMSRLIAKFKRDPSYYKKYSQPIQEWIDMGVMVKTTLEEVEAVGLFSEVPHHAVIRESSETTKVRIVNDGSAREKGKAALNEYLDPGPNFLPEILGIMLRWRTNEFFIIGDVEKAFLQVALDHEDAHLMIFRWVIPQEDGRFQEQLYRFVRLPWGICDAPFVLIAVVRYLYDEYAKEVPGSVEAMENAKVTTYVDDCLTMGSSAEEVVTNAKHTKNALAKGCFKVTKYRSFPNHLAERVEAGTTPRTDKFKVLGMEYYPLTDHIAPGMSTLTEFRHLKRLTKRQVAGLASRVYDVLGFLCPVTLTGKKLMQVLETNHKNASWKYQLTEEETMPWHEFVDDVLTLKGYTFPRLTLKNGNSEAEVTYHVFTDASSTATAAVVYEVCKIGATRTSSLTLAKNRIVPRKQRFNPDGTERVARDSTKINRLELSACLLGIKLALEIQKNTGANRSQFTYHTDSKVTLYWIKAEAQHALKYVSSRVNGIRDYSDVSQWRHVSGSLNPADLPSRGCRAAELRESQLWKYGPPFLLEDPQPESEWDDPEPGAIGTSAQAMSSLLEQHADYQLWPKNRRWKTHVRIIGWVLRWAQRAKAECKK